MINYDIVMTSMPISEGPGKVYIRNSLYVIACLATAMPAMAAPAGQPLRAAVTASTRTPDLVARDGARHPYELLSFYGVTPRATVVEIWPGGGYWTEILAPLLRDKGIYYAAMGVPDGTEVEREYADWPAAMKARVDAHPDLYDRIRYTEFGHAHPDLAPAGTADVILTFRNLHNWMQDKDTPELLAAVHRALKPGGIFGVEDHRARPTRPQDPAAESGYVRQDYAIAQIERAGFKLVGASEVAANPKDTTDWPKGVWTLPPTYALGAVDHAKYQAIGEGDNFELKFRKVD
ncbi:type 12 methyltransferase [Komagataeibacter diospyri]|uniref:Type 12 methyltransferase n=1 Tax=Komagataeibacter diospyri TaxID=1932662 RepID=A0A4P5NR52_9PROT|nr:type 12 methyltransferase [Komagataeibacter diospyri]